jgi:hypothetical protein
MIAPFDIFRVEAPDEILWVVPGKLGIFPQGHVAHNRREALLFASWNLITDVPSLFPLPP